MTRPVRCIEPAPAGGGTTWDLTSWQVNHAGPAPAREQPAA
jgi:hypothetical protein